MNCDKDTDDKAVYDDKDMIKNTAQKMETETADLVTFTEEILNGKLHFLCSGISFELVMNRILTLILYH